MAASGLALGPLFDLRTKPELDAPLPEIEYRLGHIAVSVLVLQHGAAVREPEDLGHALSVDQVLGIDSRRHDLSLHR